MSVEPPLLSCVKVRFVFQALRRRASIRPLPSQGLQARESVCPGKLYFLFILCEMNGDGDVLAI